jgi:hypothetical protein
MLLTGCAHTQRPLTCEPPPKTPCLVTLTCEVDESTGCRVCECRDTNYVPPQVQPGIGQTPFQR